MWSVWSFFLHIIFLVASSLLLHSPGAPCRRPWAPGSPQAGCCLLLSPNSSHTDPDSTAQRGLPRLQPHSFSYWHHNQLQSSGISKKKNPTAPYLTEILYVYCSILTRPFVSQDSSFLSEKKKSFKMFSVLLNAAVVFVSNYWMLTSFNSMYLAAYLVNKSLT